MKPRSIFILLMGVALTMFSQDTQSLSYQGVARNKSGEPLLSQNIGLRTSIFQNGVFGSQKYRENHHVTTNDLGLFYLEIGKGNSVLGDFKAINWGDGIYFLQLEIDETDTGKYRQFGTMQLLNTLSFKRFPPPPMTSFGQKWSNDPMGMNFMNGNIGIGFTSPKRRLVIASVKSQAQIILNDPIAILNQKNWFLQSRKGQFRIGALDDPIASGKIRNLFTITQSGNIGVNNTNPKSSVHVSKGDVYIDDINSGVVMKSPDGECWRMTVSNVGQAVFTLIRCP